MRHLHHGVRTVHAQAVRAVWRVRWSRRCERCVVTCCRAARFLAVTAASAATCSAPSARRTSSRFLGTATRSTACAMTVTSCSRSSSECGHWCSGRTLGFVGGMEPAATRVANCFVLFNDQTSGPRCCGGGDVAVAMAVVIATVCRHAEEVADCTSDGGSSSRRPRYYSISARSATAVTASLPRCQRQDATVTAGFVTRHHRHHKVP